jgi:hypothetical protein
MTAVEWLVNELSKTKLTKDIINEKIKQAMELEKQQIIDAHVTGHNASSSTIKQHDAEQYYNETYNKP